MLALGRRGSRDRRQQRRTRHADLRIGLDDLGNGDRDIEIEDLRLLHQRGQLLDRKPRHQSSAGTAASAERWAPRDSSREPQD